MCLSRWGSLPTWKDADPHRPYTSQSYPHATIHACLVRDLMSSLTLAGPRGDMRRGRHHPCRMRCGVHLVDCGVHLVNVRACLRSKDKHIKSRFPEFVQTRKLIGIWSIHFQSHCRHNDRLPGCHYAWRQSEGGDDEPQAADEVE